MGYVKKVYSKASNALSKVDDEILQPINKTVDTIVRDPKLLAAVAISIYAPGAGSMIGEYIGLGSGAIGQVAGNTILNTALNGGNTKAGFTSALIPVLGGEVTRTVTSRLMDPSTFNMSKVLATSLGSMSGSMAAAIITGGDVKQAALSGLATNIPAILSKNSTFASLPKSVQSTLAAGVSASVTGRDVNAAMLSAGIASADILARAVQGNPTLAAAFADPKNGASVALAVNAVNAGITASLQGKDVSTAIQGNLVGTSAKMLTSTASQNLQMYTSNAKKYYDLSKDNLSKIDELSQKQNDAYKAYNEYNKNIADRIPGLGKTENEMLAKAGQYQKLYSEHDALVSSLRAEQEAYNKGVAEAPKLQETANESYKKLDAMLYEYKAQRAIYDNPAWGADARNAAANKINEISDRYETEEKIYTSATNKLNEISTEYKDDAERLKQNSTNPLLAKQYFELRDLKTDVDKLEKEYQGKIDAYKKDSGIVDDRSSLIKAAGDAYNEELDRLRNEAATNIDLMNDYATKVQGSQDELTELSSDSVNELLDNEKTQGALPVDKGIQVVSADDKFMPEMNVQISGTPIFGDDPRSKNVEPPPGYRLVDSSEGTPAYNEEYDANVDPVKGTFYDMAQNAWFTKDKTQEEDLAKMRDWLADSKPPVGFGSVLLEDAQNPDIEEAESPLTSSPELDRADEGDEDLYNELAQQDTAATSGTLPTIADRVTPRTPLQVDNDPTNSDSSGYYTPVNNDSSGYYTPVNNDSSGYYTPVNDDSSGYYKSPLTNSPELDRADEGDEDLYNGLGVTIKSENQAFGPGMSEEDFINSEEEGDITFEDYERAGEKYTEPTQTTKPPLSVNEKGFMTEQDFIDSEEEGDITFEDYERAAERYTNDSSSGSTKTGISVPIKTSTGSSSALKPSTTMSPTPSVPVVPSESSDPGSKIAGGTTSVAAALPVAPQANMLAAAPLIEAQSGLQQLTQLYPQLANVRPDILSMLSGGGPSKSSYYTYGGSNMSTPLMNTSISGGPSSNSPLRNIGSVSTDPTGFQSFNPSGSLTQQGLGMIGYKKGGPVSQHVPEFITGETGYYVRGKGDGQSDDIPAMLADGEYVFDADVVAALGNGSNEAGAEVLDKMRKAIRKHKRSAPIGKIPPKAKSPLEYLKEA